MTDLSVNHLAVNHGCLSPPRHHLVWLKPAAWSHWLLHAPAPPALAAAQAWFQSGYPAIARRRQPDEDPEGIVLGIPLPPGRGRTRIALRIDPHAVHTLQAPPSLHSVLHSAPHAWREPLTQLASGADALGVTLQVYGSLLWQHLTGEPYITEHSDIDLLFRAGDVQQLQATLALLQAWQKDTGLKADGELLLQDDRAVAWRELLTASPTLMVKSATAVSLATRSEVLSLLSCGHP
jgi:phosphoribosyl-dephospho-CoA transferase